MANSGNGVMSFKSDQFREVVIYYQRVVCRWRYRHGELDQEPPNPDINSLHRGTDAVLSAADLETNFVNEIK